MLLDLDEFAEYTRKLEDFDEKQFEDDIDILTMVLSDDEFK